MDKEFYGKIANILQDARSKVYQTANFVMVEAYWYIGKNIVEQQGGEETAEYGTGLIKELFQRMTKDFGKGRNCVFSDEPNGHVGNIASAYL